MEAIAIVAIVFAFVFAVVRMSLRHAENIERIRHGYPTLGGGERRENDFIDARDTGDATERLQ